MPTTVTVKLSRGTFTCEVDGKDYAALLLSREDEPGVAYPLVDTPENAAHLRETLGLYGLGLFNEGMWSTPLFVESTDTKPIVFEFDTTHLGE